MLLTMRFKIPVSAILTLALTGCSGEIYVRDGVTDGDTFYLAERALSDDDPVLQSWVSYSLARSTCQLRIGGENPARANSFDCELTARRLMLETWQEKRLLDSTRVEEIIGIEQCDVGGIDRFQCSEDAVPEPHITVIDPHFESRIVDRTGPRYW